MGELLSNQKCLSLIFFISVIGIYCVATDRFEARNDPNLRVRLELRESKVFPERKEGLQHFQVPLAILQRKEKEFEAWCRLAGDISRENSSAVTSCSAWKLGAANKPEELKFKISTSHVGDRQNVVLNVIQYMGDSGALKEELSVLFGMIGDPGKLSAAMAQPVELKGEPGKDVLRSPLALSAFIQRALKRLVGQKLGSKIAGIERPDDSAKFLTIQGVSYQLSYTLELSVGLTVSKKLVLVPPTQISILKDPSKIEQGLADELTIQTRLMNAVVD